MVRKIDSDPMALGPIVADMKHRESCAAFCAVGMLFPLFSVAAEDESTATLAKKLQNPVASLISVPVQINFDDGLGQSDGERFTVNVQPVVPISLGTSTNLILRTIVPIIHAESGAAGGSSSSGLGDITQSFFFSPSNAVGGWIVGAGPVVLFPTASEATLGGEKWGAGPTFVALRQLKGWTFGALGNHLWSFAGADARNDINATFMQPFVSFTTRSFTTYGLNAEASYDWISHAWTLPINLSASQLVKIGKRPVSFAIGTRYYAERPSAAAEWGARFTFTMLFPK